MAGASCWGFLPAFSWSWCCLWRSGGLERYPSGEPGFEIGLRDPGSTLPPLNGSSTASAYKPVGLPRTRPLTCTLQCWTRRAGSAFAFATSNEFDWAETPGNLVLSHWQGVHGLFVCLCGLGGSRATQRPCWMESEVSRTRVSPALQSEDARKEPHVRAEKLVCCRSG